MKQNNTFYREIASHEKMITSFLPVFEGCVFVAWLIIHIANMFPSQFNHSLWEKEAIEIILYFAWKFSYLVP